MHLWLRGSAGEDDGGLNVYWGTQLEGDRQNYLQGNLERMRGEDLPKVGQRYLWRAQRGDILCTTGHTFVHRQANECRGRSAMYLLEATIRIGSMGNKMNRRRPIRASKDKVTANELKEAGRGWEQSESSCNKREWIFSYEELFKWRYRSGALIGWTQDDTGATIFDIGPDDVIQLAEDEEMHEFEDESEEGDNFDSEDCGLK